MSLKSSFNEINSRIIFLVPIVMHDESEQAKAWTQIPLKALYGELQRLDKQESADKYGKEHVHNWRQSYDIHPPIRESLEMLLRYPNR
ncbi:hypothetical protein CTI12_AA159580 [Artemisia annua]|uniref:Uncharacterized protein n=1 Tax=Artemisia annua TaxID=35608 RepID=A0A2U1NCF0_ARTAN|nr:hypothetical protein CTI12_AA159580 [Artemisia annua]